MDKQLIVASSSESPPPPSSENNTLSPKSATSMNVLPFAVPVDNNGQLISLKRPYKPNSIGPNEDEENLGPSNQNTDANQERQKIIKQF